MLEISFACSVFVGEKFWRLQRFSEEASRYHGKFQKNMELLRKHNNFGFDSYPADTFATGDSRKGNFCCFFSAKFGRQLLCPKVSWILFHLSHCRQFPGGSGGVHIGADEHVLVHGGAAARRHRPRARLPRAALRHHVHRARLRELPRGECALHRHSWRKTSFSVLVVLIVQLPAQIRNKI